MDINTMAGEEPTWPTLFAETFTDVVAGHLPTVNLLRTLTEEGYFREIRCTAGSLGRVSFFVPSRSHDQQYLLCSDGTVTTWGGYKERRMRNLGLPLKVA